MSPVAEVAVSVAWLGLVLAAAFWMRFDVPIWGAF